MHEAPLKLCTELPQSSTRSSIEALRGALPKLCMELREELRVELRVELRAELYIKPRTELYIEPRAEPLY